MHCTILLRLLARHGMRHLVDPCTPEGREGRRVIMGTVLATDMGWHFEWVERFERSVRERKTGSSVVGAGLFTNGWSLGGETLEVEMLAPEEAEREDRLFLCQAFMKCGDISNPVSPCVHILHFWSFTLIAVSPLFGFETLVDGVIGGMGQSSASGATSGSTCFSRCRCEREGAGGWTNQFY